jgi:hypothetical protein
VSNRPTSIPARVWQGFPPAKKRLAVEGPTDTSEVFWAALTVASEARANGATEEEALALVRSMPLQNDSHRHRTQTERAARFAYAKPLLLSGCCRDTRQRSGSNASARLRAAFEPYCDEECERVCPMLRAIRNPSRSIAGTPYEHAHRSNLWAHGGGLGPTAKLAYELLALLAVAHGKDELQASQRYLCLKSDGAYDQRTFGKALTRLQAARLVTLLDKRTGLRRVHAPTPDEVEAIEQERGVANRRQANVAEARKESDYYQDWLAQELTALGDVDALEAWNPSPTTDSEPDARRREPRFLQNWGGLKERG